MVEGVTSLSEQGFTSFSQSGAWSRGSGPRVWTKLPPPPPTHTPPEERERPGAGWHPALQGQVLEAPESLFPDGRPLLPETTFMEEYGALMFPFCHRERFVVCLLPSWPVFIIRFRPRCDAGG